MNDRQRPKLGPVVRRWFTRPLIRSLVHPRGWSSILAHSASARLLVGLLGNAGQLAKYDASCSDRAENSRGLTASGYGDNRIEPEHGRSASSGFRGQPGNLSSLAE